MIDLTKIKKFPAIGFIRTGNMVYIDGPEDQKAMKLYTVTFSGKPFSYIVSSSGVKYQDGNCLSDVIQVLVPHEELLETEKELEATKKELKEAKVDRNYFQGELNEVIKLRNNIVTSHTETLKKLEATEKQNDYFAYQITSIFKQINETNCNYLGCDEQRLSLLDEREKLLKELQETKQELGQLKIEYTLTCKKTTRIFDDQIKNEVDLNNLVSHLKSAIEVLTKEIEGKNNYIIDLCKRVTTKERNNGNMFKLEQDSINLYNELHRTKEKLTKVTEELEETKGNLKTSNNHRESLLKDRLELYHRLSENEKAFNQVKEKCNSNEKLLKQLKVNTCTHFNIEYNKLQKELEATKKELEVTKSSQEAAFSKVEELLREKVLLEEKIYRLLDS